MTNKEYDKKVEFEAVELNDEQLDGVSGGLVNVVENHNKDMLDSAHTDKCAAQNNDEVVKNTNLY